GGQQRLVDPVAGQRVDETGRVADGRLARARETIERAPHRQPVAAHARQRAVVDPVLGAEPRQMLAQPRALALPAADADVDVIALGEDPAIAARDGSEL